jgi:hypothetical protein
MNPIEARKRIVQTYQRTQNYCETARRVHTSPQRVRKGNQRDQQDGEQGLHDLPKTPKRQPRKTDPDTEQRVLQLQQKNPLRTPTPRPTPRPARHPAVSPHHPPHPPTPRQSHHPPAPSATPPLSGALGVGNVGCMMTTTRVGIRGMGWRVGRRMGVVWRWGFVGRGMRV